MQHHSFDLRFPCTVARWARFKVEKGEDLSFLGRERLRLKAAALGPVFVVGAVRRPNKRTPGWLVSNERPAIRRSGDSASTSFVVEAEDGDGDEDA